MIATDRSLQTSSSTAHAKRSDATIAAVIVGIMSLCLIGGTILPNLYPETYKRINYIVSGIIQNKLRIVDGQASRRTRLDNIEASLNLDDYASQADIKLSS
jgi:hypothetical protein